MKVIAEYENMVDLKTLRDDFTRLLKQYPEAYLEVEVDEDQDTFGDHHRTIKILVWERW